MMTSVDLRRTADKNYHPIYDEMSQQNTQRVSKSDKLKLNTTVKLPNSFFRE